MSTVDYQRINKIRELNTFDAQYKAAVVFDNADQCT